jgi:hypothetical protein
MSIPTQPDKIGHFSAQGFLSTIFVRRLRQPAAKTLLTKRAMTAFWAKYDL